VSIFPDPNLMFVARDGSYGDATDMVLIDADGFDDDDYDRLAQITPAEAAADTARIIATEYGNTQVTWAWMTTDEVDEMRETLEAAIANLIADNAMGLAGQLGDIRDVLTRAARTA
jgi:hypothetical protein